LNLELEGRVAIVTGAASGIGRATAHLLASEGARLILVDVDAAELSQTVRSLVAMNAMCAASPGDVSEEKTARRATAEALERFDGLDILVNNAGIAFMGTVLDTDPDDWDHVLSVNLRSVYLFSRAVLPEMRRRRKGVIVNVASEAGLIGFKSYAAYSASKAAIVNLTRSMALDHAPDGIRVNCVCPGSIETPLLTRFYAAQSDPDAARSVDQQEHPLGLGSPEDVANAIVFLASNRASYVTGHAFVVDGGYTAK
jgi:NAD(P)-dependent dehydrogenase (short-subunit alcohol dehydrogenase family)